MAKVSCNHFKPFSIPLDSSTLAKLSLMAYSEINFAPLLPGKLFSLSVGLWQIAKQYVVAMYACQLSQTGNMTSLD
jgi:hypothetical protein